MKRSVMHLAAGLAGFGIGWVLTTSPMARGLMGTAVTWDASTCPAGVYTITTMARSADNGRTHVTSSSNVTLPSATVAQEFSGLPAGTFTVTALARHNNGTVFQSDRQTLVSAGDGVVVPPYDSTDSARRSRTTDAITSTALPRTGTDSASSTRAPSASVPDAVRIETSAKASQSASLQISKSGLEYIRIQLHATGQPPPPESDWSRVSLIDSDADGLTDIVIVEMTNGDVRLLHVN